jgi:hypothetical protein
MNKNMHLENLIGKSFSVKDPAIEYVCVGYAQNDTFVVFGAKNDTVNNRFEVISFKLTEAKFKGVLNPS